MPAIAEWMMHYPTDWRPPQARAYRAFVLQQLVTGIVPAHQALGSPQTAAILLSVVALIAQQNPLAARDICNQLANSYDVIESLDPLAGATKQ